MKVNPEVSDGSINLDTELPDEQITTVDSTVLLNDGQGMVIGGLIREIDDDQRIKAAGLGRALDDRTPVSAVPEHEISKRSHRGVDSTNC
jgi:Flp pilus assembly secretin CpaC